MASRRAARDWLGLVHQTGNRLRCRSDWRKLL